MRSVKVQRWLLLLLFRTVAVLLMNRKWAVGQEILKYEKYATDDFGGYRFIFETSDGQMREELGEMKNAGTENETLIVKGLYSYKDSYGRNVTVYYRADEKGYRILRKNPLIDPSTERTTTTTTTTTTTQNPIVELRKQYFQSEQEKNPYPQVGLGGINPNYRGTRYVF